MATSTPARSRKTPHRYRSNREISCCATVPVVWVALFVYAGEDEEVSSSVGSCGIHCHHSSHCIGETEYYSFPDWFLCKRSMYSVPSVVPHPLLRIHNPSTVLLSGTQDVFYHQ
ncbi:hypothetical protein BDN70DRAFT_885470 [Pholiota conissans]|uniref:Uncharacterized protein n=1 Tax=Pholiota conissans TaxID=109636 RepID=A0A9P5YRN3_9AGAR|nr:hypothetical protein BDN70DRAFT_885470 [Pholiota conissans]